MLLLSFILLIVLCSCKGLPDSFPIKHFVVVMQENRAFDHFLGHLKKTNPNVNGLNGDESNPFNPFDKNSKRVKVNFESGPSDPNACHSIPCTTTQIFGGPNMTFLKKPPMNGFVANAETMSKGWGQEVMSCHNSETLPVLSTLANEFLVFDKWHASVPGPTEVNRAYIHSATSAGLGENDNDKLAWGLDCDIFEPFLDELGLSWGIFYDYFPASLFMRKLRYYPENFHTMWDFEDICQSGNLPTFSFIEPRYFTATSYFPANDQHPDHDVYEGEKFYKWIYEAVRASPQWNETAILILYDEHGGYYDHAPTPLDVPTPDGINSTKPPFDFTRLGIRVPAVLISPWINKGTVEHGPKGPFKNSEYEHSSIIATLRNIFGWEKNLTARDAWAGTFEHLFLNRTTPRTDCPKVLPNPPKPLKSKFFKGRKLNSFQRSMVSTASNIAGHDLKDVLNTLKTEQEGGTYCAEIMKSFIQKKNKKQSIEHEFL